MVKMSVRQQYLFYRPAFFSDQLEEPPCLRTGINDKTMPRSVIYIEKTVFLKISLYQNLCYYNLTLPYTRRVRSSYPAPRQALPLPWLS